jgi:hypothetical protein
LADRNIWLKRASIYETEWRARSLFLMLDLRFYVGAR